MTYRAVSYLTRLFRLNAVIPFPPQVFSPGTVSLSLTCRVPLLFLPIKVTVKPLETITCVDESSYRLAWRYITGPEWFTRAERWQALSVVEQDGKTLTKYETREVFGGPSAYIMRISLHSGLSKSFKAMANDLKVFCEKQKPTATN